jgi:hypothetical protein
MRAVFSGVALFLLLATAGFTCLRADATTNAGAGAPPSPNARENRMISFLTPAEQDQYAAARAKALTDNPALKTEGEELLSEGKDVMEDGTMEDKQAFMEKMTSHRQKLRQAMLKEDPTLEPVFAKIDAHISEMKAQFLHSSGATNAPPASSTPTH